MSDRWLRFGAFHLDTETGDLVGPEGPVALQPLPASVLTVVASARGTVVLRGEIQDRVWGKRTFSVDQALNTAIRQVRRALGDSATHPRFIATVPRRGYRFLMPVTPSSGPATVGPGPVAASAPGARRRRAVVAGAAGAAAIVLLLAVGRQGHGPVPPSIQGAGDRDAGALPFELRIEYAKARELLGSGDAQARRDASKAFDRVRLAEPDFVPATSGAALAALELGDAERAAGLAAWALAADSANAEAHTVLGSTLLQRGEWHAARASFQRALALDPGLVPTYTGLAVLEALDGRLDSALDLAREAVEIHPVSAFTRADAGYVALWAGQPRLALDWCRHGRDLQAHSPTLQYCVLDAYRALGQPEREREMALVIMGRIGADAPALRSVSEPPAREGLVSYRAWQRRRLDPAGDEPPGLAGTLAYLHVQDGSIEDALRLLEVAADADPGGTRITLLDPAFEPLRRDPRLPRSVTGSVDRP